MTIVLIKSWDRNNRLREITIGTYSSYEKLLVTINDTIEMVYNYAKSVGDELEEDEFEEYVSNTDIRDYQSHNLKLLEFPTNQNILLGNKPLYSYLGDRDELFDETYLLLDTYYLTELRDYVINKVNEERLLSLSMSSTNKNRSSKAHGLFKLDPGNAPYTRLKEMLYGRQRRSKKRKY